MSALSFLGSGWSYPVAPGRQGPVHDHRALRAACHRSALRAACPLLAFPTACRHHAKRPLAPATELSFACGI